MSKKYLHYYRTALNGKGHGMHSPFVFQFILHVLNNNSHYKSPATIEALRKHLLKDTTVLNIEDMGAGSRTGAGKQRSVQQLAKSAVKPKKYSQLLYRLVKRYQPQTIVELGTSLGITTAYVATANPAAKVITVEGSEAIHQVAQANFKTLKLGNIEALQGNFDNVLPQVLQHLPKVDLGYIDGNHRLAPTLSYFEQFLQHAHNDTILIFDDIHWSAEMEQAWEQIKAHPAVTCTVDIFFLGFVFFRNEFKEEQHFTIRY
ncbi:SAM-dependent methyltransferase [Flavisolibacter tropicus]|uniref:SAM-dependent methyltransferase n=1 Tax=Flavisolibacter tropicus TaxID=1492898 RepID=A0A172U245_9BACT|nr:SAM-dependent methyltransferase [Flavisolibacter tropicus]